MAYEIIGTVFHIDKEAETIPTKKGGTLYKRTIILQQRRFDRNTGQEFESNYPRLEFTNNNVSKLDGFKEGDNVRVSFDVSGSRSEDMNTHEVKFFTSLRGFNIEHYVMPGLQRVNQQPVYQQPPYQPQQAYYPPTGQPPYPPQGQDPNQPPF